MFVHHFFVLQNIIENFWVRRGRVLANFTWRDMDPNDFFVVNHSRDDIEGSYLQWIGNPIDARVIGTGGAGLSDHDALSLGVGGAAIDDDDEDSDEWSGWRWIVG